MEEIIWKTLARLVILFKIIISKIIRQQPYLNETKQTFCKVGQVKRVGQFFQVQSRIKQSNETKSFKSIHI